jgi:hypothetical protein
VNGIRDTGFGITKKGLEIVLPFTALADKGGKRRI